MADEILADAGDAGGEQKTATPTTLIADVGGAEPAPAAAPEGGEPAPAPEADKPWYADDWREKLAGGDEKFLAQLKRYSSLNNYVKAGYEAQQKIRSGEYRKPLTPDAKPEEIAQWRKENGIPEKPEEYQFDLKGYVPPESDKPILDSFKQLAHAKNMPPGDANEMVSWYYQQQEQAVAQQIQADNEFKINAAVELRTEMGPDYIPNMNAVKNFLSASFPDGVGDMLMGARLPDGTIAGNNPAVLRSLANLAREMNPGAELLPAGTTNAVKGIEGRIAEIEEMQRTPDGHQKYWQSPSLQKEYLDLVSARDRQRARAA